MFCKHNWELLSEVTTKSGIELFGEVGVTEFKGPNLTSRKHIQIVTCKKCGKLRRFVEDLP